MKKLNLRITEKGEDKSDIPEKIRNVSQILQQHTKPNQHIIAYTDGSTHRTGYGVHITTDSHIPILTSGGAVRSDGNNFIAEMAEPESYLFGFSFPQVLL